MSKLSDLLIEREELTETISSLERTMDIDSLQYSIVKEKLINRLKEINKILS